jgi:hypothetical protein
MKHPQNPKLRKWTTLAVLLMLVLWHGPLMADDKISLVGGGATLPAPLYQKWFRTYNKAHPNVLIDYQPLGSGAGISQFLDKRLDFAGTDVPLTAAEAAKVEGGVIQVPGWCRRGPAHAAMTSANAVLMRIRSPDFRISLRSRREMCRSPRRNT